MGKTVKTQIPKRKHHGSIQRTRIGQGRRLQSLCRFSFERQRLCLPLLLGPLVSTLQDFTPKLKEWYQEVKGKNVEIVFVSGDRSPKDMMDYMKESHGDWLATEHESD